MSGKSYDPLVWFLLREVWQSVPKITWANLCELVAEATKLPTPSPDSVRKNLQLRNGVRTSGHIAGKQIKH